MTTEKFTLEEAREAARQFGETLDKNAAYDNGQILQATDDRLKYGDDIWRAFVRDMDDYGWRFRRGSPLETDRSVKWRFDHRRSVSAKRSVESEILDIKRRLKDIEEANSVELLKSIEKRLRKIEIVLDRPILRL